MSNYDVNIQQQKKKLDNGKEQTEIWAEIIEKNSGKITNKLIWWEDENGIYHDETKNLPVELREIIDNAWLEKKRKW